MAIQGQEGGESKLRCSSIMTLAMEAVDQTVLAVDQEDQKTRKYS